MQKSNIAKLAVRRPAALFSAALYAMGTLGGMSALVGWTAPALAQTPATRMAQIDKPPTLQENAPDRYIVEKGDTLWGIAGKFLKEPWRWPDLWNMNRDTIRNPNRIFPGDVLVLDRSRTQLSLQKPDTVKLSPQVRSEPLPPAEAIPPIPARAIEPFLTQPLVIEANGLASAARIVGTQESRVNLGTGGVAYVAGIGQPAPNQASQLWNVYRPGKNLVDPDTKAFLGVEAIFLGTAKVVRAGELATVEIVNSRQEISIGDYLVRANPPVVGNYLPHAPKSYLQGKIIGMYNGLPTSEGGASSIVAINLGRRDGLESGHVMSILRAGAYAVDPASTKSRDTAPAFKLPDERYGTLMVFRTFEAVSYALVMNSSRPVSPADLVQTPPSQ